MSSAPTRTPSRKKLTPVTATLSAAVAVRLIVPSTLVLAAGERSKPSGAVVSGLETAIVTPVEVLGSRPRRGDGRNRVVGIRKSRRVQAHLVGRGRHLGTNLHPSTRNRTPTTAMLSAASAVTEIVPFARVGGGSVIETVGLRCPTRHSKP